MKAQLLQAKKLIDNQQYKEARVILEPLDHPTATKWISRIDTIQARKTVNSNKTDKQVKLKLEQAKTFLDEKNYVEARVILETINHHPQAKSWLKTLNKIQYADNNTHPIKNKNKANQEPPSLPIDDDDDIEIDSLLDNIIDNKRPSVSSTPTYADDDIYGLLDEDIPETNTIEPTHSTRITTSPSTGIVTTPGSVQALVQEGKIKQEIEHDGKTYVIVEKTASPEFVIQAMWFLFIGWWATFTWLNFAWLFSISIIGMPIGQWMFRRVGKVVALFPTKKLDRHGNKVEQRSIFVRGIYFVLIGWWFSWFWIEFGALLTIFIFTMPIGYWMLRRAGAIMTLQRLNI